jgi:hypothetical protein
MQSKINCWDEMRDGASQWGKQPAGQNRPNVVRLVRLVKLVKPAWPGRHGSTCGIACMTTFDAGQKNCQDEMRDGAS